MPHPNANRKTAQNKKQTHPTTPEHRMRELSATHPHKEQKKEPTTTNTFFDLLLYKGGLGLSLRRYCVSVFGETV
jgi:hypothetical protein